MPTLGLRNHGLDEALQNNDRFGTRGGSGGGGAAADQGSGVLLELAEGFFGVGSGLGLDVGRDRRGMRDSVFESSDFVRGRGLRGTLGFCGGAWARV